MLVVLWQRSPLLSAALVGPLLAIALYQRSTYRALRAMKLALTDPLTGLGNHRHFHDRLERALVEAERKGCGLASASMDVDDSKRVDDLFGPPSGDRVLSPSGGDPSPERQAFRLGGEEFALLLPQSTRRGRSRPRAESSAGSPHLGLQRIGSVTVSAAVTTFPRQAPIGAS